MAFDPFEDGSATALNESESFDPFSTGHAEETPPNPTGRQARGASIVDMEGLFAGADEMDKALGSSAANELNTAVAGQTDKKTAKMRAANIAFLAEQFGEAPDVVSQNLPQFRKSYASQVLNLNAEIDDARFYSSVGSFIRTEKEQQNMLAGLSGQLYEAARSGKDFNETYAAFKEASQTAPGYARHKDEMYRAYARQQFEFFRENAERLAEPIERVTAHMASLKRGSAPGQEEKAMAEHQEVLGVLSQLSPQDQEMVMDFAAGAAVQKTAGDEEASFIEKASRKVERGVGSLAVGAGNFIAERLFTRPEDVEQRRSREALNRRLLQRVTGEVDPLKSSSWIANGILDAAESMPRMMVSLNPVGITANLMATQNEIRGRFEDSGVGAGQADIMASVAAVPYVALDFVSSKMVFKGRLPGLERLLAAPVTTGAQLAGRAGLVGVAQTAEQLTQETLQSLTPPVVQSVASLLSESVPEVEWSKELGAIVNSTPETFAALLPLVLIGTGTSTFKDRAYGQEYLRNRNQLRAVGFTEETTNKILEAPTPEEAGALMRRNWDKRESGPAQSEFLKELNKRSIAAREEMGASYGPLAQSVMAKYPETAWDSIPANHTPIEVRRPDGTVVPALMTGWGESITPEVYQRTKDLAQSVIPVVGVGYFTPQGISHSTIDAADVVTPIPSAEQWKAGTREAVIAPPTDREFQYTVFEEDMKDAAGRRVVQIDDITGGGDGRRSATLEAFRSEGINLPDIPEGIPAGRYTLEQINEAIAEATPRLNAVNITKSPDGDFVVSDKATNAVIGTAPTQEGAAQIVQDRKGDIQARERAEIAAAPPPPPVSRPEAEGSPVPERTTALNKAEITSLRQIYNLDALPAPQRQRWEQVLNQAKEKGLQSTADALAESIIANPRLINAEEHAAMNLRAAELQNQYERLVSEAGAEFDAGNIHRAEELRRASESILSALDTLTEASDRSGTEIGRALSIRRMRINRETYRLADIVSRAQMAKQARVTPEETERFRKLSEQIAVQEAKIADLEAKLAPALAAAAEANAKTFVEEARSRRSTARRENAGERRIQLKKDLAKLGFRLNDITGSVGLSVEAATIIAKIADTYIDEGVSDLSDLVARLQETVPDLSTQDIYNAVGRRIQKQAKKIESEVRRRQRDLQNQAATAGKINDALEGKFDKAKINPSSPEAADLRQLLRELRLQADQTARDDASLKAIHEKINQIQDQISGGYRVIPEGQADRNPEIVAAQESLDALRKEMARIDRGMLSKTEAEKEAARLTREIEAIEKQIKDGAVGPASRNQAQGSPENQALRDRLDALKYERQNIRDTLNAKSFDAPTPEGVNAKRRESLSAQIADIEKQLKEGFRPVREKKIGDEVATARIRKQFQELQRLLRTEDAIADLQEQLRTGDYKVSAPEQRILQNAELEKALVKRQQLQREVNDAIEAMRKKTVGEMLLEPFNLSRALVLTADMSAALRQGIVLSARRPITATKAFAEAFTAFFSQNRADSIDLAIRRNPNQIERDKAGLYLASLGGSLNKKEESFASNLAQRIPLMGALVRGSERNMTTMLNLIRSSAFDQFLSTYPEATLEQKQAFARYINVASGRGELGKFSTAAKPLSAIFLAPRFAISRFQTPLALARNWKDPVVRREIAKDFLAFGAMGMTVLGLAALAGAQVGDDPESPDFGKIVWGNTRIDIWGGLQQPIRLMMLPILAGLDRAGIRETERDIDLIDAGRRFLSYKLSPAVNLPATLLTGKNIIGQEQSAQETLLRSISPLIAQETVEIYQQTEDASKTALTAALQFLGVGVSEQTPRSERK